MKSQTTSQLTNKLNSLPISKLKLKASVGIDSLETEMKETKVEHIRIKEGDDIVALLEDACRKHGRIVSIGETSKPEDRRHGMPEQRIRQLNERKK